MQGPAIQFDRVNLTLGSTSILQDVTFKVRPGTIHCIVGANGGGKTSLVRSLLGQMPHSGRINIQWHGSRVIGYVPQSLDFDKSLPITVLDFLAMTTQRRPVFLGVSRARRAEIERTLERLGLAGKEILERTIVEFVKAGGTVIWINHDIAQVGEIADALTYIDRKVLLDGAPSEALSSGIAAHLFPTLALPMRAAVSP